MKFFIVLVTCAALFASCGSGPNPVDPSDASAHALPPRGGRAQAASQGTPVETRSLVKFADGSLDEYTVSVYDEVKRPPRLNLQERFTASGQLVEQIEYYYWDDDGLSLLTTKITLSDENKLKSRVAYEYDDNGNLKKESLVGRNGKTVSVFDYTYDNDKNMLTRIIRGPAPGNMVLSETKYNYQNGLVVSSETMDPRQGRLISKAQNQYDADGNLTSQVISNSQGAVTRRIISEWKNGLEVKNEQQNARGEVLLRTTSEYGSSGELLRRIIENIEGQSTQILEYEYTFQQNVRR
jgi:hypothetical protein